MKKEKSCAQNYTYIKNIYNDEFLGTRKKGIRVSEYTQFLWNSIANINFWVNESRKGNSEFVDDFTQQKYMYVVMCCRCIWKRESRVKNWHLKCQMWSRENGRIFFSKLFMFRSRFIQPSLSTHTHSHRHSQTHARIRNLYVWMGTRPPRNSRFLWFCEFWAQRNWDSDIYA